MIRYKTPAGREVITSNDHVPRKGRRDRKDEVIRTSDIEQLPNGTYQRKEEVSDEKPQ